jgi:hypothetical protein
MESSAEVWLNVESNVAFARSKDAPQLNVESGEQFFLNVEYDAQVPVRTITRI